ncbi:MAG TPA: glutathione S-transferase [Alphaproteobacteria bacterium]|nr:glutathione S-transferase [Alphaproteobacteria bacterium]
MKLLYQTHSPFARKVLVMAHEAGLANKIDVIHHETSPVRRNEAVYAVNPLGQVPILVCDDGLALFDSTVICSYLDSLHAGPRLIPEEGRNHWLALRLEALANGMIEAGSLYRWEIDRRPETLRWRAMAEAQAGKLRTAYDFIEQKVALDGPLDIGQIALATALGWLEFRRLPWLADSHPRLTNWYRAFARRPSMVATPMQGETFD